MPYHKLTDSDVTYVYVNPYAGDVTVTGHPGDGVVGLANRLHGTLNNDSITVGSPSLAHLIAPDDNPDAIEQVPVGDVIIEISMGWALILTLSGLYLWWPRRSQKGKTLLAPRIRAKGRLKWWDVHGGERRHRLGHGARLHHHGHALVGLLGQNLECREHRAHPGQRRGRALHSGQGRQPGPLREAHLLGDPGGPVPASAPSRNTCTPAASTAETAPVSARPWSKPACWGGSRSPMSPARRRKRGCRQAMTSCCRSMRRTTRASWSAAATSWRTRGRGRLSAERTVYLDQFSGKKLAQSDTSSKGTIGQATEFGVLTHMGTQSGSSTASS